MYQSAVFTVITVMTSLKCRMPSLPQLRMPSYRVCFPRFVNRIPAHSTLLFHIPGTSTTNQDFLSVCPVLRASPVKTESLALPPTFEQAVWKLLCQGHYKHRGRHCPPGRPLPRRSALKKSAARLSTCVPLQSHSGLAHNATLFP